MPPFLHDGEGIWPPIIGVDGFRSSSMKDESRSKYRSKETLERRDEVLQLFFVIFPWILLLEDIWSIWTKNENKNYWKKVFDLILVIAFFFCEFLLNSLKFCGGKVTFSYGNEARIGRWSVSCENRKCKLKIKISTFYSPLINPFSVQLYFYRNFLSEYLKYQVSKANQRVIKNEEEFISESSLYLLWSFVSSAYLK